MSLKIALISAALLGCCSTTVLADGSIELDLTDAFYWGDQINVFDSGSAGAAQAGAKIISIEWTGLSLHTFNNVGAPNYGSEAMVGLNATNDAGEAADFWFFPFPAANYQGTDENPIAQPDGETISFNLESYGLHLDPLGAIHGVLTNAWDDTSGEAAGQWQMGTVIIRYIEVPAPGALALMGLAGLVGARRRRRR